MLILKKTTQKKHLACIVFFLIITMITTGSSVCKIFYFQTNPVSASHSLSQNDDSLLLSQAISAQGVPRGTPLYQKNAEEILNTPLANMLMTIVIALEETSPDEHVYISEDVKRLDYKATQSMNLAKHNYYSVSSLVCAILYQDSAACALALRQHLTDTNEEFVEKMNEKARSLGMSSTIFYDTLNDFNSTTATDLNILFRHALSDSNFKHIFNNYRHIFISVNDTPEIFYNQTISIQASISHLSGLSSFSCENEEWVCLLATSIHDDFEVSYVVVKTQTQYIAQEMDFVIQNIYDDFSMSPFVNENELFGSIMLAEYDIDVIALFSSTVKYIHPNQRPLEVQDYYFVAYDDFTLPIQKGMPLGIIYYTLENNIVIPVEIVSSDDYLASQNTGTSIRHVFEQNTSILLLSACVLAIIIIILLVKSIRMIKKNVFSR